MTQDEFEKNLDRYGANLKTWPEGLRIQAEDLLAKNESARQRLAKEQSFEAHLQEGLGWQEGAHFSNESADKIIAAAAQEKRSQQDALVHFPKAGTSRTFAPKMAWRMVASVMILVAGIYVGIHKPMGAEVEDSRSEDEVVFMYEEGDMPWEI